MKLIAHRALWNGLRKPNSLSALEAALAAGFGVETDLRSYADEIYIAHDPILDPQGVPHFDDFLAIAAKYPDAPLFLNIKEDGLCQILCKKKMEIAGVRGVFFDMSVPQLVQFSRAFTPAFLSTRISDVEPVPAALDSVEWIWVDCFEKDWDVQNLKSLMSRFPKKLAFVSPELHGRDPKNFWKMLRDLESTTKSEIALCTDHPAVFKEECE